VFASEIVGPEYKTGAVTLVSTQGVKLIHSLSVCHCGIKLVRFQGRFFEFLIEKLWFAKICSTVTSTISLVIIVGTQSIYTKSDS